jgi:hypothetical protein
MANEILACANRKLAWIYIPGNVDSIGNVLKELNWQLVDQICINKGFAILDDPLKRWINATVLDFNKNNNVSIGELHSDVLIDYVLKNRIVNNPNVLPQTHIIQQITQENKFVNLTYFQKGFNLGYLLNHFLHDNGIKNQLNNLLTQQLQDSEQIDTLSNFIFSENNRPYLNKVLKYLQDDYDFYHSAQFYTR